VQRWVDSGHLKAWKTLGGHRRIDADSVEQLVTTKQLPPAAGPGGAAPTVLVVEDNASDRDVLAALLEDVLPEAQVSFAENGFQALMAIGRRAPDLLITDLVMPHMNGLEMLRELALRTDERPRAILAISSFESSQLERLGALPADVDLLHKPLDAERFARAVRALTGDIRAA
jgi:CheY-like chemotaxis protein